MPFTKPMTMMDFFEKSAGMWLSERTVHHFDTVKNESGLSNITIELLDKKDPKLIEVCQQQEIDPILASGGARFMWQDNLETQAPNPDYGAILVDIPDSNSPRRGKFLRNRGYVEGIPVIGIYNFANDQENEHLDVSQNLQIRSSTSSKTILWGLLIAHQCSQLREWKPLEIELMKQLATQVAIAIQQSEFYTQLQHLNCSLEERVKQRTQQLEEINQSLRYSEERFRSLTENALDLIIIINLDGTIYYQNPSCEKILEYTNDELLNKNFFDLIHKDDLAQTTTQLMKSLKIPQSFPPIEFRCQQKKGTYCLLEAVSQQFIDETKELKIVINARDITEKKEVEKVKLALERQKELNTLKNRFFSMVSHEFRTPLSTALASVQLLEKSPNAWQNTEKRQRNLSRIKTSIKTMVQLLDDISLISRAESSELEIRLETINLAQFLQQVISEMELTIGKQHHIILTCKDKDIQGQFDLKLLRSIMTNLLSNSLKYSPINSQIYIYLIRELNDVKIQVRDRGMGISDDDQTKIFEPFYRGKNVLSLSGTGLGLVIVKKSIELHQGSISLDSKLGEGTTITVSLPLSSSAAQDKL